MKKLMTLFAAVAVLAFGSLGSFAQNDKDAEERTYEKAKTGTVKTYEKAKAGTVKAYDKTKAVAKKDYKKAKAGTVRTYNSDSPDCEDLQQGEGRNEESCEANKEGTLIGAKERTTIMAISIANILLFI